MHLNHKALRQIYPIIGVLIHEAQFALRSSGNPPKMEAIHGNARSAVHTVSLLLPSALPRLVFCLAAASKFASRFPIARFVVQLETPRSRWSLSEALRSKPRDQRLSAQRGNFCNQSARLTSASDRDVVIDKSLFRFALHLMAPEH